MHAETRTTAESAVSPRWLSFKTATTYAGVSEQTIRNWAKAGHLKLHNVTPMGGRGRVLIDRIELDAFIEKYAGAPASEIEMNKGRKSQ